MSSISFNSQSGEIKISGRERHSMGAICFGFLREQIGDLDFSDLSWIARVTRPGHYLHDDAIRLATASETDRSHLRNRLAKSFMTNLRVGEDDAIILDGEPVPLFELQLNSAIAWGNAAVHLCAKLHGQCEIHGYCEGSDRGWLAGLIEDCLDRGLFRPEPMGYDGWPALVAFLRSSDQDPVVTSYSVTDSFPNPAFAPSDAIDPNCDDPWEIWGNISSEQQWAWSMAKLREESGLRISPETLGCYYGDGLTGAKLMRAALTNG